MAPRIPLPEPFDEAQLAELAKTPLTLGGAYLNLFATLSHDPRLLRRVNALGGYFPTRGHLDGRTRELIILRTAGTVGCEYELLHHGALGQRLGLTAAEVEAVSGRDETHPWSPNDCALLDAVDDLLAHHRITDARWAALDGQFDDVQRMEIVMLAGFYRMIAGLANCAEIELDDLPIS